MTRADTFRAEHVVELPEAMSPGVIYAEGDYVCAYQCPCGCGAEVVWA